MILSCDNLSEGQRKTVPRNDRMDNKKSESDKRTKRQQTKIFAIKPANELTERRTGVRKKVCRIAPQYTLILQFTKTIFTVKIVAVKDVPICLNSFCPKLHC